MRRPTRHPRRPAGIVQAFVGTVLLLGTTACASAVGPAAPTAARSAVPLPPIPVTWTMPTDVSAMLLPSTGAETRWSQGLDTFTTLVANAATRSCARSRGLAEPVTTPGMFFRVMDIPDLPFIQAHGFNGGLAPGESASAGGAATGRSTPGPEQQQCFEDGARAMRELKDLYAPLQAQWFTAAASLRRDQEVDAAYRQLDGCLAGHGVQAKGEEAFFALVDRSIQAADAPAVSHLGEVYATCMAPVEAVREPLRARLRDGFRAAHRSDLDTLGDSVPRKVHELEERYGLRISFPSP
ncbi:hypothetical protein ACFVUH_12630 [Kitasatospora sp. NPDC058032]|uniref:hypothetical protein n=1 Tax=Kitasatospora sp. NPDC058032 TaxID=3346307 RepID=UPI0036DE963C